MGIRYYNPTSAGRSQGSVSDFAEITDRKKKPEKALLRPKPKKGGRNNQGLTCTRFRGNKNKTFFIAFSCDNCFLATSIRYIFTI